MEEAREAKVVQATPLAGVKAAGKESLLCFARLDLLAKGGP